MSDKQFLEFAVRGPSYRQMIILLNEGIPSCRGNGNKVEAIWIRELESAKYPNMVATELIASYSTGAEYFGKSLDAESLVDKLKQHSFHETTQKYTQPASPEKGEFYTALKMYLTKTGYTGKKIRCEVEKDPAWPTNPLSQQTIVR